MAGESWNAGGSSMFSPLLEAGAISGASTGAGVSLTCDGASVRFSAFQRIAIEILDRPEG